MYKILVTGAAGFIGFHFVSRLLLVRDIHIFGLDNLNDYYDIGLKNDRLVLHGIKACELNKGDRQLSTLHANYQFIYEDIENYDFIVNFFVNEKFDYVVNLAAQAGVRYSLINPRLYTSTNISGFLNILEGCRQSKVKHLVYASTSSVYGLNSSMPLTESQSIAHPVSLYAATKKSNELMAHSYSHLYFLPTTGLRFFTVYGPWGRPDMALYLFASAMVRGETIKVFNYGKMKRDFTYVDDIVDGIFKVVNKPATSDPNWDSFKPNNATSSAPYQIFNIGNSNPVELSIYINTLERYLNITAKCEYVEMQPGDVIETQADTINLEKYVGFKSKVNIDDGVKRFVEWFESYRNK